MDIKTALLELSKLVVDESKNNPKMLISDSLLNFAKRTIEESNDILSEQNNINKTKNQKPI